MIQAPSPTSNNLIACIGCGALVPDTAGLTHSYIGALPGCWAIFGEVLAKEYGEYNYPAIHRMTVDTYAAQHPGVPSRHSIQSVAIHLISLHLMLERGFAAEQATKAIRLALQQRTRFVWLAPPPPLGALTVLDVRQAKTLPQHEAIVTRWAKSVWQAWQPHHATIHQWAAL